MSYPDGDYKYTRDTLLPHVRPHAAEKKNAERQRPANLAEIANMGVPVRPGFSISTEACLDYLKQGELKPGLMPAVRASIAWLEDLTGKSFGAATSPLLVSVRSGGQCSMPGTMDTQLEPGIERRHRRRPGAQEQLGTFRVGGLSPTAHHVRRYRARHRSRTASRSRVWQPLTRPSGELSARALTRNAPPLRNATDRRPSVTQRGGG